MKAVETQNISVGYAKHKVIENLSLSIKKGEFLGILGPNGSGKTTLLRTMTRILKPDAGVVYITEKELSSYTPKAFARELGCVNQQSESVFSFTVRDVVMMGRNPHLGRFQSLSVKDYAIADKAMKETNTLHLKDRLITELSGGEHQRVMIAKTLAQQPKILLLDEPTNHLDISHQIEILELIRSLTPEITVVSVLHDLNFASYFCDRIVLMANGEILAVGKPAEILTTERIYQIFSVRMMVYPHPITGRPYMVPQYGFSREEGSKKIHVISGGGRGSQIFPSLLVHGFSVTAGALATNDTDTEYARILGIETVVEQPFSALTDESICRVKALVNASDAVVVSDMPIGRGNIANIRLLLETETPIYLIGTFEDFSHGEVVKIREKLISRGAVCVPDAKAAVLALIR
ncbi:MAG TPA: ABC transporter ATP-binding protein [Methanocorpusculum sp.]|nr:ABC transporter ATP-binding protein [Methanocorpusculum sp.]